MPSCQCRLWCRTRLPCKHFFALFRHYPDWGWNQLPPLYQNSVQITLDEDVVEIPQPTASELCNDSATCMQDSTNVRNSQQQSKLWRAYQSPYRAYPKPVLPNAGSHSHQTVSRYFRRSKKFSVSSDRCGRVEHKHWNTTRTCKSQHTNWWWPASNYSTPNYSRQIKINVNVKTQQIKLKRITKKDKKEVQVQWAPRSFGQKNETDIWSPCACCEPYSFDIYIW